MSGWFLDQTPTCLKWLKKEKTKKGKKQQNIEDRFFKKKMQPWRRRSSKKKRWRKAIYETCSVSFRIHIFSKEIFLTCFFKVIFFGYIFNVFELCELWILLLHSKQKESEEAAAHTNGRTWTRLGRRIATSRGYVLLGSPMPRSKRRTCQRGKTFHS